MKLLVLLILGVSCSSKPGTLSEKAKDLEVYPHRPANCHVVGKVVGQDESGSTELATNHALNQAAKLNATGVVVNQEVPNGNKRLVYVTAYHCN